MQARSQIFLREGVLSRHRRRRGVCGVWQGCLFHLKWLILVQIPLYILTEMLGYLLLGPQQLLALAADGVRLLGRFWGLPHLHYFFVASYRER